MMQAQFTNAATARGTPCELIVSGEIDLAVADRFYAAAAQCFATDAPGLVIDLGGVTFLDSTAIGALIRIRTTSSELDRTLLLANLSDPVVRLLTITGLDAVFDIEVDHAPSVNGG